MKKILFSILIVLLSVSFAWGQGQIIIAKKKGGGESVLKDSSTASPNTYKYFGYNDALSIGGLFTAGSAYTLTSFKFSPTKQGTGGNCTVTGKVYTNSSATPTTLLGTSTNTINSSTFDGTVKIWTFTGVGISNATYYWLVLEPNSTTCGTLGNYPSFGYNNVGSKWVKTLISGSWSSVDADCDFAFETWGY